MERRRPLVAFLVLCLGLSGLVAADVTPASPFTNHMMIQRDLAAPVWGTAGPGEKVTVRFAGQEKSATADGNGLWMVRLDPVKANAKGQVLEITGKNTIKLQDVLVGDIWVCSGQSNMEFTVGGTLNSKEQIAAAKFPAIRLFDVRGHVTSATPQSRLNGQWQVCTPQTVGGFSAVGYFFGRRLHQEAGIPIGLIGTNWGGTRIEPWTPPIGFRSVPQLKAIADQVDRFDVTTPAGKATWMEHLKAVEAWVAQARAVIEAGTAVPVPPRTPGFTGAGDATAIYNAMVHPLVPFGICGAIWYQGESNGGEGESYFHKMQALIGGWRKVWGQGDFPFLFVQLADFQQPNDNPMGGDGWARLREAQRKSLTIPNAGMAVIIDIGNARDIHPRNKQDVGSRLAQWALHHTYGKDIVPSGPLYKSHKVEGSSIRIAFDWAGKGLMVGRKEGLAPTQEVPNGKLQRFAIAGADKQWHWADAIIDGETVVVSSKDVPKPVAVRYAFSMNPEGANLYNREGLPASPFRTDAW